MSDWLFNSDRAFERAQVHYDNMEPDDDDSDIEEDDEDEDLKEKE